MRATHNAITPEFYSPSEMMGQAEQYARYKTQKPTSMTLGLAIMAGVFIGIAFLFYITVTTGNQGPWGLSHLAGGIAFSLGLILVVLCGGELFTSSVLTSVAYANRDISLKTMLSIWGKVYVGNFIGALFLLMIVSLAALYQSDHGQWGLNALNIAQHKLHHTTGQAFALGVLCNLLVCLAIWLTFSTGNALAKAMMVILPVAMFVSSGFEHCVANMFMIPLGIVISHTAPDSFWQAIGTDASLYADLTVPHFLVNNLIPVTLGNIVGGAILVGLSHWYVFRRPHSKLRTAISKPINTSSKKDIPMLSQTRVKDLMTTPALTLSATLSVPKAMDFLFEHHIDGAPVTDGQGHLLGYFSLHDVLLDLWCQDYLPDDQQTVADLMQTEVIAVDAQESLINIAEFLCIDKTQIYPTTDNGIAITLNHLSIEERAKQHMAHRPHHLPVLDNQKLVGVLPRQAVAKALRAVYKEPIAMSSENEMENTRQSA
ncbi:MULTISPECIES: formate transporter FocA [unclassified Vibrio]|uniref:Formate transporter FocA n=1 Tax=Vibrio sp. HB236076 TaxID=3232307 RepID=A0AB39HB37_9VIBR|nr:formate transporter FocA [Vibrio sp. HB161653]MDP5255266.1 formate transporter FocA [Vibrio sp. HB161653]